MIQQIRPDEAQRLLSAPEGYIYLDVRTTAEFAEGHVPGAKNVPVMQIDPRQGRMVPNDQFLGTVQKQFPREAKIIVGCQSGGRSQHAAQLMESQGYLHLSNMVGGFGGQRSPMGEVLQEGWSTLGLPIERGGDSTASTP